MRDGMRWASLLLAALVGAGINYFVIQQFHMPSYDYSRDDDYDYTRYMGTIDATRIHMIPFHVKDDKYKVESTWKEIYRNEEDDYIIYIDTYYKQYLSDGTEVSYSYGKTGKVRYLDTTKPGQFSFVPDDLDSIYPGVSGEQVFVGDKAIGFINGWDGAGGVLCTFY